MDHQRRRRGRTALLLILLLYGLYAGAFILRTSFVVDGVRRFCLLDDAMISMRYARNLAEGHGPVWNPGEEAVEGITNPLWTGTMAMLHLTGAPESKVSLLVQISSAVFLLANLVLVFKIARFLCRDSLAAAIAATVLTAFYYPLNKWALQGMEVGAAALLVTAAVWMAIRTLDRRRFSVGLYVVLAVGVLLRMDLLIPGGILCGLLAWIDREHRRRHCLAGFLALGVALAGQTLFRFFYYGDLLPNTYYLKMTGYPALLRICRGLIVLADFVWNLNWMLFLLPAALLIVRRDRYVVLLLAVFGGQLAYSAYVGGDAWEEWGGANRYVAVAMPLFFVLLCVAMETIVDRLSAVSAEISRRRGEAVRRPLMQRGYLTAGFVLLCLISFNTLKGPHGLRQCALVETSMHVEDHREMLRRSEVLRHITAPDAQVGVTWAGIMPYFADRVMIDFSGKNDKHIARLPMHQASHPSDRFAYFHPGHLKWDYGYSIGELQPDVVLQAGYPPGEAKPFLDGAYREVMLAGCRYYLRKGSPRIDWEGVAELGSR